MRFIQKWSYGGANYLAAQLNENHEKRSVYYFGLQVVIGELVKTVLLILISWVLGLLTPVLICAAVFAIVRTAAGGYHMNTHGKCFATSIAMFLSSGLIVKYTSSLWSVIGIFVFILLVFIFAMIVFIKWAPADTPNKPITKPEEIRKYKTGSIIYGVIWLAATSLLAWKGFHVYSLAMVFGLLMETLTVAPAGYRFFDRMSGKVSRKKRKAIE